MDIDTLVVYMNEARSGHSRLAEHAARKHKIQQMPEKNVFAQMNAFLSDFKWIKILKLAEISMLLL